MDINEIKKRKANLEDEILAMINNFMKETGVRVDDVCFNVRTSGDGIYKLINTDVKIRIVI